MTMAEPQGRFSPLGVAVVGMHGQLLWEVGTPVFRCRMPATQAMRNALDPSGVLHDPLARPCFALRVPKAPFALLEQALTFFRMLVYTAGGSMEGLVYLHYAGGGWKLAVPMQQVSASQVRAAAVRPEDRVAIEIHSHGRLPAYFSETDDADEVDGFIYGVLGDVTAWSPSARFRVGHAGCFYALSLDELFRVPRAAAASSRQVRRG